MAKAPKMKKVKKVDLRLKRRVRRTAASLLLITSIIVAAIPVPGVSALDPTTANDFKERESSNDARSAYNYDQDVDATGNDAVQANLSEFNNQDILNPNFFNNNDTYSTYSITKIEGNDKLIKVFDIGEFNESGKDYAVILKYNNYVLPDGPLNIPAVMPRAYEMLSQEKYEEVLKYTQDVYIMVYPNAAGNGFDWKAYKGDRPAETALLNLDSDTLEVSPDSISDIDNVLDGKDISDIINDDDAVGNSDITDDKKKDYSIKEENKDDINNEQSNKDNKKDTNVNDNRDEVITNPEQEVSLSEVQNFAVDETTAEENTVIEDKNGDTDFIVSHDLDKESEVADDLLEEEVILHQNAASPISTLDVFRNNDPEDDNKSTLEQLTGTGNARDIDLLFEPVFGDNFLTDAYGRNKENLDKYNADPKKGTAAADDEYRRNNYGAIYDLYSGTDTKRNYRLCCELLKTKKNLSLTYCTLQAIDYQYEDSTDLDDEGHPKVKTKTVYIPVVVDATKAEDENPVEHTSAADNVFEDGKRIITGVSNPIVAIANDSFKKADKLLDLTITNRQLTYIGDSAFEECPMLTSFEVAAGTISHVGNRAFKKCVALKSISLANKGEEGYSLSPVVIGAEAFRECSSLASIDIPASTSVIGAGAFSECLNATKIDIQGNGATPSEIFKCDIRQYAFYNDVKLSSSKDAPFINWDAATGITRIGKAAFATKRSDDVLTDFEFPPILNSSLGNGDTGAGGNGDDQSCVLEDYILAGRGNLQNVYMPKSAWATHQNNPDGKEVYLPKYTFARCYGLGLVDFRNGELAFFDIEAFNDVTNKSFYISGPGRGGTVRLSQYTPKTETGTGHLDTSGDGSVQYEPYDNVQGEAPNTYQYANPRLATWRSYTSASDTIPYKFNDEEGKENREINTGEYLLAVDNTAEDGAYITNIDFSPVSSGSGLVEGKLVIPPDAGTDDDGKTLIMIKGIKSDAVSIGIKNKLTHLVVPGSEVGSEIEKIEAGTFADCPNLVRIELGDTVKDIGASAFENAGTGNSSVPLNVFFYANTITDLGAGAFRSPDNSPKATVFHGKIEKGYKPFDYATSETDSIINATAHLNICYKSLGPDLLTVIRDNNTNDITLIDYPRLDSSLSKNNPDLVEGFQNYVSAICQQEPGLQQLRDDFEALYNANDPDYTYYDGPWNDGYFPTYDAATDSWIGGRGPFEKKGIDLAEVYKMSGADATPPYGKYVDFIKNNYTLSNGNVTDAAAAFDKYVFKGLRIGVELNIINNGCRRINIPEGITSIDIKKYYGNYSQNDLNYRNIQEYFQETYQDYFLNSGDAVQGLFSSNFKDFEKGVTYSGNPNPEVHERGNDFVESITLNGVTKIPDFAFDSCENLKSLIILGPEEIGNGIIRDCTGLNTLRVKSLSNQGDDNAEDSDSNFNFRVLDKVLYEKKDGGAYRIVEAMPKRENPYPSGDANPYSQEEKAILEAVDEISPYAFVGCKNLIAVDLISADKIDTIPEGAFMNCNGLTNVYLNNSVDVLSKYSFYMDDENINENAIQVHFLDKDGKSKTDIAYIEPDAFNVRATNSNRIHAYPGGNIEKLASIRPNLGYEFILVVPTAECYIKFYTYGYAEGNLEPKRQLIKDGDKESAGPFSPGDLSTVQGAVDFPDYYIGVMDKYQRLGEEMDKPNPGTFIPVDMEFVGWSDPIWYYHVYDGMELYPIVKTKGSEEDGPKPGDFFDITFVGIAPDGTEVSTVETVRYGLLDWEGTTYSDLIEQDLATLLKDSLGYDVHAVRWNPAEWWKLVGPELKKVEVNFDRGKKPGEDESEDESESEKEPESESDRPGPGPDESETESGTDESISEDDPPQHPTIIYENEDDDDDDDRSHNVTVINGVGGGRYRKGNTVTITANPPGQGMSFAYWSTDSSGVSFNDGGSSTTTFKMPGNSVTVTANFKESSGIGATGYSSADGSGSSGGSGNGGGGGRSSSGGSDGSGTQTGYVPPQTNARVIVDHPAFMNLDVASATVDGSGDNFVVRIISTQDAENAVNTALYNRYGDISAIAYTSMDISLYDSTGTIPISDTSGLRVNLTLPIPYSQSSFGANNRAAAVTDTLGLEDLSARYNDINGVPTVSFTCTHFSPYTIYVDTNNLVYGTDASPKTGDPIHPKWFLALGLLGCSIFLFMKKERMPQAA